jgi:hypothetical protein
MTAVQGERIPGGFILITGIDGVRYAVRHHAVAVILDADECRDEIFVQLHGGHDHRRPSGPARECRMLRLSADGNALAACGRQDATFRSAAMR